MSNPTVPSIDINLEFLRKEAKSLLKQCRLREPVALRRVRAGLSRLSELDDDRTADEIQLADVQHALAREHGYTSWAELKRHEPKLAIPDYSRPAEEGVLPEGYTSSGSTPWRWSVTYTVRPEILAPLIFGHEYKILISVLRKTSDEPFTGYAALYERATEIGKLSVSGLSRPDAGMFLHTRVITHGWFRHENFNAVRAFMTVGVRCLKEGEAGPQGEPAPSPEELTKPGGMTRDKYVPPPEGWRIELMISEADARDTSMENSDIFVVSYGEYVPTCSEVDYKPFIERAESFARLHYPFLKEDSGVAKSPSIIRREWFCATTPDIAVVHIYLRV